MKRLHHEITCQKEPMDVGRPIHFREGVSNSLLGSEMHPWLQGFTQEGENMRCPFLASHSFDCNDRLYHTIEELEAHLVDAHAVGLHVVEENDGRA
jgi:hypothetical protein